MRCAEMGAGSKHMVRRTRRKSFRQGLEPSGDSSGVIVDKINDSVEVDAVRRFELALYHVFQISQWPWGPRCGNGSSTTS